MEEIAEELTSDETTSGYIAKLTKSIFPDGKPALPKEDRSENEIILTSFFARAKLMTAVPENLRHMLGNMIPGNVI